MGPRVLTACVCLALSLCVRVDRLSVCGRPFGSLGPECVCLPGSVSWWTGCLFVGVPLDPECVCLPGSVSVSGWMGSLFVGVPLGPRVLSVCVCLALSPRLWVGGLSVCECPLGSSGPEYLCLPGSVSAWTGYLSVGVPLGPRVPSACVCLALSHSVSGWTGCLSVGVPLGPRVPSACVFLALSVSGWMGCLSVSVPWVWVCVCVSQSVSCSPPPAAWFSVLSHLCSSVRLGFLLGNTVS